MILDCPGPRTQCCWLAPSQERRIFVTRDKDFGGLVFVEHLGRGVILLRLSPSTLQAAHEELKRVLGIYSEAELASAFVVVERF